MICVGSGLKLFVIFANGSRCPYSRVLLVIDIDTTNHIISCLNVSGLTPDKQWKLSLPSNKKIDRHYPPFINPSFVKLDERYLISSCDKLELQLCDNGSVMEGEQFSKIVTWFNEYREQNRVIDVVLDETKIKKLNPILR